MGLFQGKPRVNTICFCRERVPKERHTHKEYFKRHCTWEVNSKPGYTHREKHPKWIEPSLLTTYVPIASDPARCLEVLGDDRTRLPIGGPMALG